MGKKILITGGGGYIGSIATEQFLKAGFEVVVFDNFSTGFRQPLEILEKKFGSKLKVYDVNLHDDLSESLDKEPNIEAVVHFAGSIVVAESVKDPNKYFYNNVCGSVNLLRHLQKKQINKIVFSSTCTVCGEAQYMPIDEKHPTNPNNPYGESKKMVEDIIQWAGQLIGLKFVIFRYFNVCGASEGGNLGYSNKPPTHLVQNLVRGALGIEPFRLTCATVDTPDKTPIRDYINILDLVDAHIQAVNYLFSDGSSEIINLGTGTGYSVLEIVKQVENITGFTFELVKAEPRGGETPELVASIKKAKEVLDWEPKRSLEDSIKSTVAWYKAHPNGWEH